MKTELQSQKERYEKKLKKKDEEILRLTNHLARGKNLLHRVTLEMGDKQNERDLAVTRAEALHKLLIAVVENNVLDVPPGSIQIPIAAVKSATERMKLDIEVQGETYILSLSKAKEEGEPDGAETEQAVVSASDQASEPAGDSQDIQDNQAKGVSGDQGTQG